MLSALTSSSMPPIKACSLLTPFHPPPQTKASLVSFLLCIHCFRGRIAVVSSKLPKVKKERRTPPAGSPAGSLLDHSALFFCVHRPIKGESADLDCCYLQVLVKTCILNVFVFYCKMKLFLCFFFFFLSIFFFYSEFCCVQLHHPTCWCVDCCIFLCISDSVAPFVECSSVTFFFAIVAT